MENEWPKHMSIGNLIHSASPVSYGSCSAKNGITLLILYRYSSTQLYIIVSTQLCYNIAVALSVLQKPDSPSYLYFIDFINIYP